MAPKARSAKRAIDHLEGRCKGRLRKSGRLRPKRREQGPQDPPRVRYRTYALALSE